MGKFKKMGMEYEKDFIVCPNCKDIFVQRSKGKRCPHCEIKLVYPTEGFVTPLNEDGFIWLGEWKKISEVVKKINEDTP